MRKAVSGWVLGLLILVVLAVALDRAALWKTRQELARKFPEAHTRLRTMGYSFHEVSLRDLVVEDPSFRLEGSVAAEPFSGRLVWADLHLRFLRAGDLELADARLRLPPRGPGSLEIRRMAYKKLVIEDWKGVARSDGKRIEVEPFGVSAPFGRLRGRFKVKLDEPFEYEGSLSAFAVESQPLLRQLEWDAKARLIGRFSGTVDFRGDRQGLTSLQSRLSADPPGGELVIADRAVFENLAARTGQPVQLIEAGLSRYHFQSGRLTVDTRGNDLESELFFEGPAGTRRLQPIVHGFFKKENG